MKRIIVIGLAGVAAALLALGPAAAAWAHPLGNFTVNRYAGLLVQSNALTVDYVVDMAEIPAYQEISQQIDRNHDGVNDEAETTGYRERQCAQLPQNFILTLNGKPLPLELTASALEFPPGAAGLATLRLTCTYRAALANPPAPRAIAFSDGNFRDLIGWRELVVQGDGATVRNSTALAATISNRLRSYPNDLLSNPPKMNEARFEFDLGAVGTNLNGGSAAPSGGVLDRTQDAFAALVEVNDLSLPVIILSLLVALGLGALHAVSPGHGKTMIAAYLVGSRGTIWQALLLGLTVTVTHTTGVLVLGVLTLFASRYILPESLYPWLSLSSGIIVVGMGLSLAWSRWRLLERGRGHPAHAHAHPHAAGEGDLHHHHHDHDAEPHEHSPHMDESAAELEHARSHLPANFEETGVSWRSLIGLGLVGGLVPSASALIVLLAAISLQRIAFGIVLVVAFGVGMALVLVGTGVVLVRASHFLERRRISPRSMAWMPLASAVFVIGAGMFVTAQAMLQMGLWKP